MTLLEVELLDIGESDSVEVEPGLSVPIISSVVHGVGGTGQVCGGNLSANGTHLLGDTGGSLREERWCSSCSTWGEELAWVIGLEGCIGFGMRLWGVREVF